ncbi:MAG: hypothetical protein Q8P41_10570 [Pseudomonadota bacterium]|nr:hypothetical protein [Pseudomonadota bacterium]
MRIRLLLPVLFLTLVAAKGGKKKGEPAPTPAPEPTAAAAPVEAAPAPVEEAPPAPPPAVKNADLSITIAYADGTSKAGRVTGIERTVDFQGDEGWTTEDGKLRLTVEAAGTEKQVPWKDVKSLAVAAGKIPDEVDCTYSSDFSPWMYECTLRTNVTATMKDGSKGTVSNRHRWRFSYDDGSKVELSVYKYTVREQDDRELQFGDEATENFALYTKLQDKLRSDAKTTLVKAITVQ